MRKIRKFRDLPDWDEARKMLAEEVHLDGKAIALVGEQEGDSLDLVEVCTSLEQAFGPRAQKTVKS
ncbi:MAG TPA: hypothetical protein VFP96_18580 [Candidatus Acidoferrum sp.]|nr:hypothetical protein [Candidatus Acidoferrum sp.]